MVQQIVTVQPQPSKPVQQSQTQTSKADAKTDGGFQSVMQQSVDKLNQSKGDKPSDSGTSGKKSDDQTNTVQPGIPVSSAVCLQAAEIANQPAIAQVLQQIQAVQGAQPVLSSSDAVNRLSTVTPSSGAPVQLNGANPVPLIQSAGDAAKALPTMGPQNGASAQQANMQQINSGDIPQAAQQPVAPSDSNPVFSGQNRAPVQAQADISAEVRQAVAEGSRTQQVTASTDSRQGETSVTQIQAADTEPPARVISQSGGAQSQNTDGAQTQETVQVPVKQSEDTDKSVLSNQNTASFHDLMKTGNVVIKISDAPANTPKTPVHQVTDQVLTNYKAGNSKLEIELFPRDLGKVTVKMAMQNGTLTVDIAAANPKTQSMLLSSAGEIRSILESTVNHPVHVLQDTQDRQWYQQDQNPSQSRQQQEQQQHQHQGENYRADDDDTDMSTDDFLSVMQQLRVKASAV
ncbi:MAG TPA: flagellar hook-length control protein FliK [Caproiciproducens sp.]|nr:flagellar hook-length control protein FliK [Caproiciproducens sp.]